VASPALRDALAILASALDGVDRRGVLDLSYEEIMALPRETKVDDEEYLASLSEITAAEFTHIVSAMDLDLV
jgi:hypothetical protein